MESDETIVDALIIIGKVIDFEFEEGRLSDDDLKLLNEVWYIFNRMVGGGDA